MTGRYFSFTPSAGYDHSARVRTVTLSKYR
jgi:hypothetical protein